MADCAGRVDGYESSCGWSVTGAGPTVPVSIGGGNDVTWSQGGSELFYRQGTRMSGERERGRYGQALP